MSLRVRLRGNTKGYVTRRGATGMVILQYTRSLREMVLMRQTLMLDHGHARDRALWRNGLQRSLMGHYSTLLCSQPPGPRRLTRLR